MSIKHHISDDLILAYATGELDEATSLLVATHMALCPTCRHSLEMGEALGGALLESETSESVSDGELLSIFDRIDTAKPAVRKEIRPTRRPHTLPQPLRDYVGGDVDAVKWKSIGGVRHCAIDTAGSEARARLLRIPAGQQIPEHSHRGLELTLVLSGSFYDEGAWFRRGDVEEADATVDHHPIAGPEEDCICLAVTDAPLRFRGLIPRLVQPFIGL